MSKVPEYWVPIPESEQYEISNFGNVRRKLKNGRRKKITTYVRKGKWVAVKVRINLVYKERYVHHLVAAAFVEETKQPGQVLRHKNGLIRDNYAGNLEWIDRKELGRRTGALSKSIPVVKLDAKTGEVLNFYKSISAAARDTYIHKETICMALKGKLKTAAGFKWKLEGTEFEEYGGL